ncbi:hypothetical protein GQF01_29850 [Paenibacillus sp. 5J-6]|uniref:SLH domain-containing protein n=1 Tax=Paenibacillus silvestris TaxID=2606219 RepID=A0A6L8V7X3_9BACL|nr:S-layer homology domain-containing protein [Paenibacillus silvestris]MZQ86314.1 hypothetical protein [Paenibacillus silvestris]
MKMKLMTIFVLICILSLQTTAFAATNLQSVEFSQSSVTVGTNANEFSVGIIVTNNALFSGAEFGLGLEGNIQIKSVDYTSTITSENKVNTEKDGVHYFGFFDYKNIYNGKVNICNVTFTYTGNDPAKVTMKETNVTTTTESGGATKESITPGLVLNVNRESAGNPPSSGGSWASGPSATPVAAITSQELALITQNADQKLNELLATKNNGGNAQTALKQATDAVEKAIEQQSTLNISGSVKVDGDTAKVELNANAFTDLFKTIMDQAAIMTDKLKAFDPNAEVKVTTTLDLGTQTVNNAEIPIIADLVTKAKEAGIDAISFKINGVSLAVDVDQFTGITTLTIKKQPAANLVTNLKLASDIYNFEFMNSSGTNATFTKPVIIRLPITVQGLNSDLFSLAKIVDGKLEFYGGHYDAEDNYSEGERKSFSTYAIFENKVAFKDIADVQAWAGKSIGIAAAQGIVQGRSEGEFAPNAEVTRAEFAAMIVKAFHLDDETATESFNDVNEGDWFKSVVASAAKAGIIHGRSDEQFAPNEKISRAEMATIASNALVAVKGYKHETDIHALLSKFKDSSSINSSLAAGVALAASLDIVVGYNDNFAPNDSSTRAQAAVVIERLLTK